MMKMFNEDNNELINITRDVTGTNGHQTKNSHPIFFIGSNTESISYEASLDGLTLVAGTTGSGLSLFLETLVLDIASKYPPDELELILVDPKRVQFANFSRLPHLLCPMIIHMDNALPIFDWLDVEQNRRIKLLVESETRYTEQYNELHPEKKIPHIVVIIDELAELMLVNPAFVETSIIRLAALAPNLGIHLVISTQNISTEIITNLIKFNTPALISFKMSSFDDSKSFIGVSGAQDLKGKGDLLYVMGDIKPIRLQAPYVSQENILYYVGQLAEKYEQKYNNDLVNHIFQSTGKTWNSVEEPDPLYAEAVKIASAEKSALSIHLLSSRLGIGYSRAVKIMNMLKEFGGF